MQDILGGITTFEKVRALLGVSQSDIDDTEMEALDLHEEIKLDLAQWFPEYPALMADDSTDSAVVSQQTAMTLYTKTFCAWKASIIAPMKFLQKRADGDNQGARFSHKDALTDFQNSLAMKTTELKVTILSFTTAHSPAEETKTQVVLGMAVAGQGTDPIVG